MKKNHEYISNCKIKERKYLRCWSRNNKKEEEEEKEEKEG
jgi:hypothetical protein